jgi:hypothetical protein
MTPPDDAGPARHGAAPAAPRTARPATEHDLIEFDALSLGFMVAFAAILTALCTAIPVALGADVVMVVNAAFTGILGAFVAAIALDRAARGATPIGAGRRVVAFEVVHLAMWLAAGLMAALVCAVVADRNGFGPAATGGAAAAGVVAAFGAVLALERAMAALVPVGGSPS